MSHQLACDVDAGGCGKLNHIHHILSTVPKFLTIGDVCQIFNYFDFSSHMVFSINALTLTLSSCYSFGLAENMRK